MVSIQPTAVSSHPQPSPLDRHWKPIRELFGRNTPQLVNLAFSLLHSITVWPIVIDSNKGLLLDQYVRRFG